MRTRERGYSAVPPKEGYFSINNLHKAAQLQDEIQKQKEREADEHFQRINAMKEEKEKQEEIENSMHTLEKYQQILSKYDIATDEKGNAMIIDINTEKKLNLNKEQLYKVCRVILFARAWYNAVGNSISIREKGNTQARYDEKIWQYAFESQGTQSVYDNIIKTLINKANKSFDLQEFIDEVAENTPYQFTRRICENLLNNGERDSSIDRGIKLQLLSDANLEKTSDILDEDIMDLL